MSSIFHILKEEHERLNEARQAYEAAIAREEQGAPQIKHLGRQDYLYLARRNGPKVRFRYIGQLNKPEARKVMESVNRRREYEELLKGVKADLKEVKRALRGKI